MFFLMKFIKIDDMCTINIKYGLLTHYQDLHNSRCISEKFLSLNIRLIFRCVYKTAVFINLKYLKKILVLLYLQ